MPIARLSRVTSAVLALAATIVVVTAAPAAAHATPVSESPRPGAALPQAPGYVVIRFSEAVDTQRSAVAVSGAHERDATSGATADVPGDSRTLRRPLGLLTPGRYVVRWTSVSLDDGHLESGSYSFSIGVATGHTDSTTAGLFAGDGVVAFAGHLLGTTGLVLWAGLLVVGRAARRSGLRRARQAALLRLASGTAVIGALVAQGDRWLQSSTGAAVLLRGTNAQLQTLVLSACAVGWLAMRLEKCRVATRQAGVAVVVAVGVAVAAEAASGHRAGRAVVSATSGVIAVHLAALGIWIAAISCSLTSSRRTSTLKAMSRPAIGAAVAVLFSGVVAARLEVHSATELTGTRYGAFVIAKLAVFAAVAGAGAYHWHRRRQRASDRQLRRPLAVEALTAATAIVLGTLLAAAPPPVPASAAAPNVSATQPGLRGPAATLAAASGPYVVTLTVSPPRPGRVGLAVEVLGAGTHARVGHVAADARSAEDGRGTGTFHVALRRDPGRVFTGSARFDRRGTWTIGVDAVVSGQPVHVAFVMPVPAPAGSRVLSDAIHAEGRLASVALHETVRDRTDGPDVVADYTFQAPDAISFAVRGSTEIDIGRRAYRREHAGAPWRVEPTDASIAWPAPYFRQFWGHAVAVRVLGTDLVDGVMSQVVAFARPDLPAWFRIWVGTDGLVRREEMLAEHHLMVHTYSAFNRAPSIHAPVAPDRMP